MATVYGALLDQLTLREEDNVRIELVRKFIIKGLTQGDSGALKEALADPGVPAFGSTTSDYPELLVTDRQAEIHPHDPTKAIITVTSKPAWRTEYFFAFEGSSTLQQKQTQNDGWGDQIYTEHTFDVFDPDWPSQTRYQGGDVSVLAPQATLQTVGIVGASFPDWVAKQWIGFINSTWWRGDPAYTWMCTRVDWREHDLSSNPAYYKFFFEFQHDPQSWIPQVVYIDPRTGKPPTGIILGEGAKYVDYYPARDFRVLFWG